jgi:hypothetical protein
LANPKDLPPWRSFISSDGALILVVLGIALAGFFGGERTTYSGGFGWDGQIYGAWVRDFPQEIFRKGVNAYYIQRILPAAIIHYAMKLLRIPLTDANILNGFGLLNVGLFTLIGWCWCGIVRELDISTRGKWLGLVGFFGNWLSLKYIFFLPVLTDFAAYALGVLMLYCYLHKARKCLYGVTLLGAFTWPLCLPVGALLLIFPRPGERKDSPTIRPAYGHLVCGSLLTLAVAVGIRSNMLVYFRLENMDRFCGVVGHIEAEPIRFAAWLSLGLCAVYLWWGSCQLLNNHRFFSWTYLLNPTRLGTAGTVLLFLAAIKMVQHYLSVPDPTSTNLAGFLQQTAYNAVAKPGVFLVTHVAFYGPMILLAFFLWKPIGRLVNQQGPGLALALLLGLLLSLNSQSRFVINLVAMLIPFIVKATDALAWDLRQYGFIGVLCLLGSKVWLTINPCEFTARFWEFPTQFLFMNQGPWISNAMYLVQGAIFLFAAGLIYVVCFLPGRLRVT